jgi:acyl-CoA thioesterase
VAAEEIPLKHNRLLEHYQEAIRSRKSPFPYGDTIGFQLTEVEPGRSVIELDCTDRHWNTVGTVHGGVHCSVADTAMGIAHGSLLGAGEIATTVDLQIHFLRPMRGGRMRAEAKVVKHGRTLSLVECDVRDSSGSLIARASSQCMTLRPGELENGESGSAV